MLNLLMTMKDGDTDLHLYSARVGPWDIAAMPGHAERIPRYYLDHTCT